MDQIPERCLDCRFFKLLFNDEGEKIFKCMLSKPLILASGCPNHETDNYIKSI